MLEPFGIRPDDEIVYRALLSRSEAETDELASALDRDPIDVVISLTALEELGLVHRLTAQPLRVRAARPDVAIDSLVNRRKEEFARAQLAARDLLAEMPAEERYRPEDIVEVLVGRDAIAARFEQLLVGTRKELLVLDRPPYASSSHRSDESVRRLLSNKTAVRGIYAPEALDLPGALEEAQDASRAGERSRVHADLPMKLAISDGRVAILPIGVEESIDVALCIRNSALMEVLVRLFELLWSQSTPIVAPDDAGWLTDRELASLLATGAKDDVVARHLGTSKRTLSRHIARLMNDLHVRTRFQAGAQAVRLGWLDSSVEPSVGSPENQEGVDDCLVDG